MASRVKHRLRYTIDDSKKISFCYQNRAKDFVEDNENVTCKYCIKAVKKQRKEKRKYFLFNCDAKLASKFGYWAPSEINEGNTVFYNFVLRVASKHCGLNTRSFSREHYNRRNKMYNDVVNYFMENEDIELNNEIITSVIVRITLLAMVSNQDVKSEKNRTYLERIK